MNTRAGLAGFLPWRGFLMIDVIAVGMVFFLAALSWSVFSVKRRHEYRRHKWAQIALSCGLVASLALFEIDVRYFDDWRAHADGSPYFDAATGRGLALYVLWIHLGFAVSTVGLWLTTLVGAVRGFPGAPAPGAHSRAHARWGRLAAIGMGLTAATGWLFYVLAFVA
jgi:putative membrane protein